MRRLRSFLWRMRGLVRARQIDADVRSQIEAHLEEAAEEHMRRGLSAEEARRAARVEFGSVAGAEETCRDVRGRWHQDLTKDLGYGLRMLRRSPGFSAIAILSLAVGIGANSAIFSIVDSVLLRPRPVADPERLVALYVGEREQPYQTCSYPSYLELRDRNQVFSGLAAYTIRQFRLGDANEVEYVWGETVSADYFDVLGVRPALGRTFVAEEGQQPGRDPVVVISHGLWRRRFNSDASVVGRAVTINGQKLTVIGVTAPQFMGMTGGIAAEMWVPLMMMPALEPAKGNLIGSRGSRWLVLAGRLRPEVSVEQAQAHFDALSLQMQALHPEEWRSQERSGLRELFVWVLPERATRMHPSMREAVYGAVALLVAVVNLVLLITCMNLAGMLLARAVARRREIAVRLALGASRFRLIRQLLVESVLLSLIAGALGLVAGVWILGLLLAFMPPLPEGIRVAFGLTLDWRVVAYTMGFATLTGMLFGLAPALQSSKTDVASVMKDEAGASAGGYRRSRLRSVLIVAQVALSLLLLISAGLLLRSLENVRPTRLGYASDQLVAASLSLDEVRYDRAKSQAFYRALSERIASLPGVRSVSLVEGMPGGFMSRQRRTTEIEGYTPAPEEDLHLDASFVGPNYFTNMKVPLVEGREFDARDRDGTPCVAVVNEAFRRRYFSGTGSPLGKHLAKFESDTKVACEIVGVVRDDEWQSLQRNVQPFFWLALYQSHRIRMSLIVNTEASPEPLIGMVRHAVRDLDPNLPASDIQTVGQYFEVSAYPFRLLGLVLVACGVMALLLAAIGIYGLVAYSVAQRTREIGIRIALGAAPREIVSIVVRQGMTLVAWGLGLGLFLSYGLTRALSAPLLEGELLFGVAATDPLTFAGVPLLLALAALAACAMPAIRATRIDPLEALRYE